MIPIFTPAARADIHNPMGIKLSMITTPTIPIITINKKETVAKLKTYDLLRKKTSYPSRKVTPKD
jgi:hypothetical protein